MKKIELNQELCLIKDEITSLENRHFVAPPLAKTRNNNDYVCYLKTGQCVSMFCLAPPPLAKTRDNSEYICYLNTGQCVTAFCK